MSRILLYLWMSLLIVVLGSCQAKEVSSKNKHKVLIVDGQNNHGIWPKTTIMMKQYLEETGLFEVDVERTRYLWLGPHHDKVEEVSDIKELLEFYPIDSEIKYESLDHSRKDSLFSPNFNAYDVVITNFGWQAAPWPDVTIQNFEKYIQDGGGLVVIHAANNSWPEWKAYNKMIGLGGWGGRTEKDGPYVYYTDDGEMVIDTIAGNAGSHGPQHEFVITSRAEDHPIMNGLPNQWLHTKDELYDRLRGPAENLTILATAYSDKDQYNGTGRHEPALMAIEHEEGRIFHSILGHMDYSMECVGFITTFIRGTEWAASGEVTFTEVPEDFPGHQSINFRKYHK